MRSKTKTALLLSVVLWIVGMMVWPGCAVVPLPSKRQPVSSRKAEDFAFPKTWPPSRSDIVRRLGEPDVYLSDLRVACYRVNEVTRRKLWLCLFVIPMNVDKRGGYVDIAFIEYDGTDHVKRSGIGEGYRNAALRDSAKKWLAAQAAQEAKPRVRSSPRAAR